MTFEELAPVLSELDRSEKWKAMQFLMTELAKEETTVLIPHMRYPVWTPIDAFEAANTLLMLLESQKSDE